jgi:hypothetical protein
MILRLHSTSIRATTSEFNINGSQVDDRINITFDIDGPPEITSATTGLPHQPQHTIRSPSRLASLYQQLANPFLQTSRHFPSYEPEHPSAYPTPINTPPHTSFSQIDPTLQEQTPESYSDPNQTLPFPEHYAGYTLDHSRQLSEEASWNTLFADLFCISSLPIHDPTS